MRIRSLAASIIGMLEFRFRKRQRDGGEVRDQPERAMGDCACHKKCLTTVNNYDLLTLLHGGGLSQLRRPEVPTGASFFCVYCWR